MRLTLVALLFLCGVLCTGCESLNKTARWPRKKDPAISEQLANDLKRREATDQVAQAPAKDDSSKTVQRTNFPPSNPLATDPTDGNLLKAKQAEQARQNQVAKTLYEQVLQQQPQNAEAHHRLGVLADQDGRYPEAQQHYQAALQQQQQNPSLLSDVGYSFYSQDRLDEAEYYLKAALQLQPENQYARNNLGQVYSRRAQQTGSPADMQMAQQHLTQALGPQGAAQELQQLAPPANPTTADRFSQLNPFKKLGGGKSSERVASNLTAPEIKDDGNDKLLKEMERIRDDMVKRGELPPTRPADAVAQRPRSSNGAAQAIPPDQLNSEMVRIEAQARRMQIEAMQQANSTRQNGTGNGQPGNWNGGGQIERVSWGDSSPPEGPMRGGDPRMNSYPGNQSGPNEQSGGWNQQATPAGYPGAGYRGNGPYDGAQGNPAQAGSQDWSDGNTQSLMGQTWPHADGSPTQIDSRGNTFGGSSPLGISGGGTSVNPAYEMNDPTYYTGEGRPFGAQRPGPRGRSTNNNRSGGAAGQPGWDQDRNAAAQLGLDAGMGDMFPGGTGDPGMNSINQPGNAGYGDWGGTANGDGSAYGNPANSRGMQNGQSGAIAPANYNSGPGYQQNGQSQGSMGDRYGNPNGDATAPWNQPGMSPRSSRSYAQPQSGNYPSQPSGRFAPSRQQAAPQQDLGAPPMWYGQ